MTLDGGAGSTSPRARSRWVSTIVGVTIGLAGGAFVVRALLDERDEVLAILPEAEPLWLVLAVLFAGAAMTGIGLTWRAALRLLGAELGVISALRGYFVGQLGKYVPGGVWAVMGRGEWARREGIPGPTAYTSVLLSMGTANLSAILLVALLVPFSGLVEREPGYTWVLAFLPLGFLAVHPMILGAGLRLLRRLTGRELVVDVASWSASSWLVIRQLPSWIAIGLVSILVTRALGASVVDPLELISATALAWAIGFIILPVPGGIGVREAVFVATATTIPSGVAATVALIARLIFILVDGLGAATATALTTARAQGRAQP
jgi:glycosyltransferase 2 family protein